MAEANAARTPYPANTPLKGEVIGVTSAPVEHLKRIDGQSSELAKALIHLETAANGFVQSALVDPAVRDDYMRKTRAAANDIMDKVKRGLKTPHEGAQEANALRNEIMRLSRADLTTFGLALSKDLKTEGKPLDYFYKKYAWELYKKLPDNLTQAERERVLLYIIERAGNSNGGVNLGARIYGYAGRALLIASVAIAVYKVAKADDKSREASKQVLTLGASVAGGVAGGALVGFVVSNPAGWIVGVAMFVTAAAAGYGSEELFDYYWPEH